MELVQGAFEEIWDKMEMERKRIYYLRRSALSEADNVIEALKFEEMSGSPRRPKLGTGKFRLAFKK